MPYEPQDVARWMKAELDDNDVLYQDEAVEKIADDFGEEFVYINDNGNLAIERDVLEAFRELTAPDVVWERGDQYWRFKMEHEKGDDRRQSY